MVYDIPQAFGLPNLSLINLSLSLQVLHAACVPLFEMIRRWVFEGQIEDPHGEFFVVKQRQQQLGSDPAAEGDMWRSGYAIDGSRLPQFLSQKLASRILRAGKSVNFLQEFCGEVTWVQERAMSAQATAASAVSIGQVRGTAHQLKYPSLRLLQLSPFSESRGRRVKLSSSSIGLFLS